MIKQLLLATEVADAAMKEANQVNAVYKLRWVTLVILVIKNPLKGVDAAAAALLGEQYADFQVVAEVESTVNKLLGYLTRTRILRFDQLYRSGRALMENFLARVQKEHAQGIADPEELRIYNQFLDLEEQEARRVATADDKVGQAVAGKDKELQRERDRADQAEADRDRLTLLLHAGAPKEPPTTDPDRRNKPR